MEADGTAAAAAAAANPVAGTKPLTPEEEALRRNTDCVYFLASPLTCKKGNECDFRHSEGARMNPRDCWYWLNSNCLNPKCPFRHPPIDGMFGAPTPGIPSVASLYAPYSAGKQTVPCYYFQKGNCTKGDRCHFYHGPPSAGNNPPEQMAKVSSLPLEHPQTQKSDLLGTKDSVHPNNSIQQGAPIINDRSKMTVDLSMVNSARTATVAVPVASNVMKSWPKSDKVKNSMPAVRKSFTTSGEDHPECYQNDLPMESDPVQDWKQNYEMPPADDLPQNSREADELLGESSPGFDVLVDNHADGAAYLHDGEDFGREMYPVEDYEYAPADFDIRVHHERERFNGMDDQGQIGQVYDGYERKRRRSSERNMERPFHPERRFLQRDRDPVDMDGSDLRHRLSRRRINESSLDISPERNGEQRRRDEHYRERAHGHRTHRDHHQGSRGSTLSSRLQGRIKLPGRSPDRLDIHSEKDGDRKRLRDRLSPSRRTEFQGGRHHREAGQHEERTRRRSNELALGVRNADGQHSTRDATNSPNFATRQNIRDSRKVNGSVEPEASVDFEGPKPLSVILQRKREASSGNGSSACSLREDKSAELTRRQSDAQAEAEKEGGNTISSEEYKSGSGDEEFRDEDHIPVEGHGQCSSHGDKLEVEDIIEVDPMGNQDADNHEQGEGESYYEAIEGDDYKSEDENAYEDDEEEFDEDDDFARKVGVVFT